MGYSQSMLVYGSDTLQKSWTRHNHDGLGTALARWLLSLAEMGAWAPPYSKDNLSEFVLLIMYCQSVYRLSCGRRSPV